MLIYALILTLVKNHLRSFRAFLDFLESATKLVFRFFLRRNDPMAKVQKYGGSINFLHLASAEMLLNVSCWGWQLFEEKAAPVFNVK